MIRFIFFCAPLLLLDAVHAAAPAAITLGGVFSHLDSNGVVDPVAAQRQAAFLFAIEQINNKTDGVYDDLLPDTQINFAVRHANTPLETMTSINSIIETTVDGAEVKAVVNGLTRKVSHFEVSIAELSDIFMIRASTLEPFTETTPPRISILPDFPFEIGMTQKLFCLFASRIVSIISDGSADDVEAIARLTDGSICEIQIVSIVMIGSSQTFDMIAALSELRETRINKFVIITSSPALAGRVLESGFELGLFREGTQVTIPGQAVTSDTWEQGMSEGADVATIMKGNLAIQYRPNIYSLTSARGSEFFAAWIAQPSTAGIGEVCNAAVDGSDMAQQLFIASNGDCSGLDFSAFSSLAELSEDVFTVYDAVVAYAAGMHRQLYDLDAGLPATAMDYMQAITDATAETVTQGISGVLSFDSRGIRNSGVLYAIVGFNGVKYSAGADSAFNSIGAISSSLQSYFCSATFLLPDCGPLLLNTANNQPVPFNGKYKNSKAPEVIKIAIYVNLFDDNGDVDTLMVQYLSAILMAIREVNDKADGIYDTLLPKSKVVLVLEQPKGFNGIEETVYSSAYEAFGGSGILGSICMLGDAETILLNQKYISLKIPVVSAVASSAALGDGLDALYNALVNPLDSYEGVVWQHIMCNLFEYRTFAIFASDDYFGQKASIELVDGTYCGIKAMHVHNINRDGVGIEEELALAKTMGARIFVFAFSTGYTAEVAMLLEQGYEVGVFGDQTQIFGTGDTFEGVVAQLSSDGADVKKLMKGVMFVKFDPLLMMTNNEAGLSFYERWRNQPATEWTDSGGRQKCNQQRDDDDYEYLYRDYGYSDVANFTCAGLNYSSFSPDASDVAPYLAHAYDATLLLLHGLNTTLYNVGFQYTTDQLMDAILYHTMFVGATGDVDIFEGMAKYADYGRGSREVGHAYDVMNFNSELFDANGPGGKVFQLVYTWTEKTGAVQVQDVEFNSNDNSVVADHLPDIINEQHYSVKSVLLIIIAICCVLVSAFFIAMIGLNRSSKVISSSQPIMSVIILIGGILVAIRVLNASFHITDSQCIVGLWFGHLAFVLVFCALFVKMWRLATLINAGLKKVKISEWFVVYITGGLFALMVLYLCVLTWVGQPRADLSCENVSNRNECDRVCSFEYPQLHTALFCLEGVAVFYGAYLCYKIKGAPAAVNDSKENGQAILILAVFAGGTLPAVFLLDLDPGLVQLIASSSIGICYIIMAKLLYTPKLKKLLIEGLGKKKVASESSGNKNDRSSAASESNVEGDTSTGSTSINLTSLIMKRFTKLTSSSDRSSVAKKEPPHSRYSNAPSVCHPVNEETHADIKAEAMIVVDADEASIPI